MKQNKLEHLKRQYKKRVIIRLIFLMRKGTFFNPSLFKFEFNLVKKNWIFSVWENFSTNNLNNISVGLIFCFTGDLL